MRTVVKSDNSILAGIRRSFARHRRRHHKVGRAGYPESLKALALSALRQRISHHAVADAAGISRQSLTTWLQSDSFIQASDSPRELTLIESSPPSSQSSEIIQIHLRSGVRIDLGISALTPMLIDLLGGGVR